MSSAPIEAELAELREAVGDVLDDVFDDGPLPEEPSELERVAVIATVLVRNADLPEAACEAYVDLLAARGEEAAATLLAASAKLAPRIAASAAKGLERLREAGVEPRLPAAFGRLRVTEARRARLSPSIEVYTVQMERPGDRRAQVASFTVEGEGELAGVLVRGMVSAPVDAKAAHTLLHLDYGSPDAPETEPVALECVDEVLRTAAVRMRELDQPASGELALSLPLLGQAVCGDAGVLGGISIAPIGYELFVEEDDEEGFERVRDGLLAELRDWIALQPGSGYDAVARNGEFVARAMLEWKWGYADGKLGEWTVEDLEEFFLDYAPRKLPSDEDVIEDAPDCALALIDFLEGAELLGGDPPDLLEACCEELRDEFAEAARDRGRWGPAKALIEQMRAEGVEPTDQATLDAWIEDFNSRPFEERDRVLGPSNEAMDRAIAKNLTGDEDAPTPWELGGALDRSGGNGVAVAMGWFPASEYERALERWDELRELWAGIPHPEYCQRMEATFRGWHGRGVRMRVVPLRFDDYLAWCEERDEDPEEARAAYAADISRRGLAEPWPPGRNEPCWCGSARKYKKCCGQVGASALHPLRAEL